MKHKYSYSFLAFLFGSAVAMECGAAELYTFSGVSDNGAKGFGIEATSIHCTNIGNSEANVEVEVFSSGSGSSYPGTATLNAGETYTFSTQNTSIYFDDVFLGGGSGTNSIYQGHGRIHCDNGNIICTAQMLDGSVTPPKNIVNLELRRSDSAPPPTVPHVTAGDKSLLYYFTGVSDDGSKGGGDEATVIHCTNIDSSEVANVEVQVYTSGSGSSYSGTATFNAGHTFTFSTQNTSIYFDDIFLGGGSGTNAIYQGHGRVFSDNDNIICTAQMLDGSANPPEYSTILPMFDKNGYPVNMRKRTVYYPIISR